MKYILFLFSFLSFCENSYAQRNLILIIADDLGTDYFGFNEDHKDTVDVPNIRALLKKGVRFSNAASNPFCSSTRSGILTGRYSLRTGVGGVVGGSGGSNPLDTSEITIPRMLKKYNSSFMTANIGKWHLHQPTPASNLLNPNKMGYDHFEGPFIGQLPSFTNWTKFTNGVSSNVTTYATTENVNNAISWIKTKTTNKPFFVWLAFNAPHEPLNLPPTNLHSYTSLSGTTPDINANPKSYFKAMIQAMDHEIGRLFDSLKKLNRWDSTDIIFIGDNGNTPRTAQITDLTKAKGTIYQYGIHIPFIISGPSVVNGGRSSDALINTTDIFATVLDLFGFSNWQSQISEQKPVDSKSIFPILKNQSVDIRPWSFSELFKLTTDSSDGKAMRNKEYKLIKFDYGKQEFYNLISDPLESNNLLLGKLSSTELLNYNYLCDEMTTLVGKGTFCDQTLGGKLVISKKQSTVINPFSTKIKISNAVPHSIFELTTLTGEQIFKGENIQNIDLGYLAAGVYYLKIISSEIQTIKLIKQ